MTLALVDLVAAAQAVAATRSRKQKTAALAALLAAAPRDEVALVVAWLGGTLPQGALGVGPALVRDAAQGAAPAEASGLTVREVDAVFSQVQAEAGSGSRGRKLAALAGVLARATAGEQDFLVRLLCGALRQGALEGVMVEALAAAYTIPAAVVRRAAMLRGDLAAVARVAAAEGEAGLAAFRLQLLRPLQPMLAQTAADPQAALAALARAAFEWKLDGARVQVHKQGDEVAVFTRQLHDVTRAVPEVVELVRGLPAETLLLDGEVLALREDGRPQPFQVTMRRFGRKADPAALRASLPLRPFFFDCLHADGTDLFDAPAHARAAGLRAQVPEVAVVGRLEATDDVAAADAFYDDALARGHEGLVAKALDAPYEAGRRGAGWLKIKPAHTLDLVVLAAEWGSGRRQGWLSNLHLGARDPQSGGFVMLGKTFKGLTDALLAWQTEALRAIAVRTEGHVVHVRPQLVVEIAFDGVQQSPQMHPGGVALRFARVKGYRADKTAVQADTIDAVRACQR